MENYKVNDGVGIIPEGTTVIADDAFRDCTDLISIDIPVSVKEIGDGAQV